MRVVAKTRDESTRVRILLSQEVLAEGFSEDVANPALVVGRPIQIFPMGRTKCADGRKLAVDPEDVQSMLGYAGANPNDFPVTYDHERDVRKGSQAAGWFDDLVATASGLFSRSVKWTKEAASEIAAQAWRYVSGDAAGYYDDDGWFHPRRLLGASLVPKPAVLGMDSVTLSDNRSLADGGQKGVQMDLTKIRSKLGLAADASEEDVMSAIETFSAGGKGKCAKCGCALDNEPTSGAGKEQFCKEHSSKKMSADEGQSFAEKPPTRDEARAMFTDMLLEERKATMKEAQAMFAAQRNAEKALVLVEQGLAAGKILATEKAAFLEDATLNVERFATLVLPNLAVRGPVSDAFKPGPAPTVPEIEAEKKPVVVEGFGEANQAKIREARAERLNAAIAISRDKEMLVTQAFAVLNNQNTGNIAGEAK